ncbi:MAG: 3-isopropylmalate dehydrogenase [Clostridiales bacterium]|jgi:3-isopropylmalate dehydrogenase|nr:3-isopropylmalate dehydrogenase [Clostridiales bacterium]
MRINIAVIDGDGIGPEVCAAAIGALDAAGKRFGHELCYRHVLMGGAAIDKHGIPLPDETVDICKNSGAVLLGAVGGPKWDGLPGNLRPEAGLLGIRKSLGLYANIRPARLINALKATCPLKDGIRDRGIDMVVVRELTGGMYFGKRNTVFRGGAEAYAYDTEKYSVAEIERIARKAYEIAAARKNEIISIDKANVLDSGRLWRKVVHELNAEYPKTRVSDMLVDNAAMQLIKNPSQFDVVLTPNMFGDILSDEAAMITGSIGVLASASLGDGAFGLYEPIHGSAPDIAGQDKANPVAAVLSAAMLLKYSFGLNAEAAAIENAVDRVLEKNIRTADIAESGSQIVGCKEMGRLIAEAVFTDRRPII